MSYCENESKNTSSRAIKVGVCGKWLKQINDCRNPIETLTHEEKCCREHKVPDICFGYCEKESKKTISRKGVCRKWIKLINKCIKG